MLCKLCYTFKLNVLILREFCWFMQNAENFLQQNCIMEKITFGVALCGLLIWCLNPEQFLPGQWVLCVKILLWNGRTCSMSSWTSHLWIEITPAMSAAAHWQRKAFEINKSAMDLADFREEHSSDWTSGKSPHEHSPEGKAAIERKCCPSNWELESWFATCAGT